MEHISQLLVRARKITANSNKVFIFGIVEYRPDLNKFTAGGGIKNISIYVALQIILADRNRQIRDIIFNYK